ncbi:MAG: hypothetical protein R3D89_06285 [Sphingomonadaceae bacterium]
MAGWRLPIWPSGWVPAPSLWPDDPVDRALAAGFSSEICGRAASAGRGGWECSRPGAAQLASADDGGLGKAIGEGYGLRDEAMQAFADAQRGAGSYTRSTGHQTQAAA